MIYALAYLAMIPLANWAISTFGLIPMGFGLVAPAGVLFAGLALGLRDKIQDRYGKTVVFSLIALGSIASLLVSPPSFALASGLAFMVSELFDFAVYTPLRASGWTRAVIASNIVGAVVDSALFLGLAFGDPVTFLPGQLMGKLYATAGFILLVHIVSFARTRKGELV